MFDALETSFRPVYQFRAFAFCKMTCLTVLCYELVRCKCLSSSLLSKSTPLGFIINNSMTFSKPFLLQHSTLIQFETHSLYHSTRFLPNRIYTPSNNDDFRASSFEFPSNSLNIRSMKGLM